MPARFSNGCGCSNFEQVTRNVSKTCRFCGVSRSQFYEWRSRYHARGPEGLRPGRRGPKVSPFRLPRAIEDLILQVRRERAYGAWKIGLFLQRYHQTYVSVTTIARVLRDHGVARLPRGRRPLPPRSRRRELTHVGESVQVDVKHLHFGQTRFYQFNAIDKATRFRVLKLYDHNSMRSAVDFLDELRRQFPAAIQRIQTDHGTEDGSAFTWQLHDVGIDHRRIPSRCPAANGKVERSHRTDADEFYRRYTSSTPQALRRALAAWQHEYNHLRAHLALKGATPAERLLELRVRPLAPASAAPTTRRGRCGRAASKALVGGVLPVHRAGSVHTDIADQELR